MSEELPIIDVSCLSKYIDFQFKNEDFIADKEIQNLGLALYNSFSKWGFVYVTGHTIDQCEITQTFESAKRFF